MNQSDPFYVLAKHFHQTVSYRTLQYGYEETPWIVEALISSQPLFKGEGKNEPEARLNAALNGLKSMGIQVETPEPIVESLHPETEEQQKFRKRFGKDYPHLNIGHLKERLLLDRFLDPWSKTPPWLKNLRLATPEEDSQGIDLIAQTDAGDVPIQIKSSGRGARKHEHKYGMDIVSYVYPTDREAQAAYEMFIKRLHVGYLKLKHSK